MARAQLPEATLAEPGPADGIGFRPDLEAEPSPPNTRFFGVYQIAPERYGRDLSRLSQEILRQLTAVDGVDLEVTIDVQARRAAGFPVDKVRIVLENARTLKFTQAAFEND